jgi:methionyl-tRNA formyltransferase
MKIGIIANSDLFIPLAYTLAMQKLQVYIFYCPSEDPFTNQKTAGFTSEFKLPFTEEKKPGKHLYQWLKQENFDTCFVIGYPQLIQVDQLKHLKTKLFNIHFSTLPAHKGAAPVFWQLKNGTSEIGLSIHAVTAKFDDGPVVWTKEVPNLTHYNYSLVNHLFSQLCVEGALFILRMTMSGIPLPVVPEKHISSYQKKPGLQDISIHWNGMNAKQICDLIRACNPWNKGACCFYENVPVKLLDAKIENEITLKHQATSPGTIVNSNGHLHILCSDQNIIRVNTILYNDVYLPSYHCESYGIKTGKKFT